MSLTGHLNPIGWARVGGVYRVLKIDETQLTNETILMIGRDYGFDEYDPFLYDEKEYYEYIEKIVEFLREKGEE